MRQGTSTTAFMCAAGALAVALFAVIAFGPGAPPAEAANACKRWGGVMPGQVKLDKARRATQCLLNQVRRRHGLRKLDSNRPLKRAAQRHSRYMDRKNCFAHVCPGEPGLEKRLRAVGYLDSGLLRWGAGENIAWGEGALGTPRRIVRGWMRSPSHRRNILDPGFRDLGIGVVWGSPLAGRHNGAIYTTDFGYRVR